MSAAEYLAWEREQPDRHEFHDGEVFAMAGGSPRHNLLSLAVGAELRVSTRGKGCNALSSDQRIAVKESGRYVYADAALVCGPMKLEPGTKDVLTNPSVVIEVLSQTTEAYDRGDKWEAYQSIESLTDYVLLAQKTSHVEHYRREPDGSWRYRACGAGESIVLANGTTLSVDAIYEGAFDVQGD
jgi:Uma2 family endonuclease